MALTSNELRLGNFVLVRNKVVKIEGIDEQGINSSVSGGYYPGETEIEYEARFGGLFNPEPKGIPLSPEVLIACGFQKNNNAWRIVKDGEEEDSYFNLFDKNMCHGDLKLFLNGAYLPMPAVTTLHQLQNLYYSLTGQELNYKP